MFRSIASDEGTGDGMTDGTPPDEGQGPAAAPPWQPPASAGGAPVPPYAAHLTAGARVAMPRQEYPGAPPTWIPAAGGPYAPAPTPAPSGSAVLAILALVAAILGAVIAFVPLIGLFSWLLLIAAVVLAIVALARRAPGKGMAIAAIVVAALGFVASVVWSLSVALFGGWWSGISDDYPDYSDDYSDGDPSPAPDGGFGYPSLSAPDLDVEGSSVADALPLGTAVTLHDDSAGDDVWDVSVGAFEDITAAASADTPMHGAFVAVPVELTNLTDEPIYPTDDYAYVPYSRLITGDGGTAEVALVSDPDAYPSVWEIGPIDAGESITYYEIFDVGASVATSGTYVLELDSGQQIHWGPGVS
jgi:hypothetical protein